jgi:hypothetical protein
LNCRSEGQDELRRLAEWNDLRQFLLHGLLGVVSILHLKPEGVASAKGGG